MRTKGLFLLILLFGFILGVYYHYLLEQLSSVFSFSFISSQGKTPVWQAASYILTHFFTIFFTLSVVLIGSIIVLENRNPSKTVAWLVILTIFPIVGFIFYIFVGRNVRKRRRYKHKSIDLNDAQDTSYIPVQLSTNEALKDQSKHEKVVNLLLDHASSPMTRFNHVEVLSNGGPAFAKMIEQMEQAKDHIHVISFIVRADELGRRIQRLLMEKARSGVQVRFIIDGLGSRKLPSAYVRELREAGVEVRIFSPVLFPYLRKVNYRNHRKLIIVDGIVGFVGGLNIGDEYLGKSKKFGFWRDTHMMVKGDAVYFLQYIFLLDWRFTSKQIIEPTARYFPSHDIQNEIFVQIAASGPDSNWEYIQKVYFSIITNAKKRVYIATPYLIPDDSILMALKVAALSGIDVRIIVPGRGDHPVVYWASRSYFMELMEAGVKLYSYQRGFIHAKILVADGEIVSLGTANFDIRSFHYNFEVNGVIYDSRVAKELEEDFRKDVRDSLELDLDQFQDRPISQKVRESVARLMSPLL
jgi:cardiolipin synthase A/B